MSAARPRDISEFPLMRAAMVVYWFVLIDLLVVLAALPGAVLMLSLAPDATNLPLFALSLVPFGPAVGAAVFAWRSFLRERSPSPAREFWRGYRMNVVDVLKFWVPLLALLTVLGVNLANLAAAGVPPAFGAVMVVIAVMLALWGLHMMVITSLFSFRLRDAARLAAHVMGARFKVTLAHLSLLVVTIGLVGYISDWVLMLVASVLTFLLVWYSMPVITMVQARFVTPAGDEPDPAGPPSG
ncbi:DUF624 domain-containing protein [Cellulomonas bogoriensis]|uniref:DUF624 domain-containing protein n=1 Tax=Cellulomonas bogoriensis 69B4 = DSM 16987 TaxID=1386082 RepID=A0A0A0BRA3_9CELL|nr:DUF624 domain-containing protein [Cellulomonas bogoriensis]KGM10485.1 hypothetical protein N869_04580 [Cellulomonas bogoriensis 69B4 = DSM 16987]